MPSSCKDLRERLVNCIRESPCFSQQGYSVQECINTPSLNHELPEECRSALRGYFECRRSMIDMRKRFRQGPSAPTEEERERA